MVEIANHRSQVLAIASLMAVFHIPTSENHPLPTSTYISLIPVH